MEKRYQVFVSSTYSDLIEERKEATQAILKCKCFPAGMELFPASNESQWNVIKKVIDDSDFYLLIIAGRYGSLGINSEGKRISYTEMEFDYAKSINKPIIALIHDKPGKISSEKTEKTSTGKNKLEKFKAKASNERLIAHWHNKYQLKEEIVNSLNYAKEKYSETAVGWIRANTITTPQKTSSVLDDIRQDKVLSIKEKINSIHSTEDMINFLEQLSNNWYSRDCFKDSEFVEEFAKLISITQPNDIILRAINIIPTGLIDSTEKQLQDLIDVKSLFNLFCHTNNFLYTELYYSFIQLLEALDIHTNDYDNYALDIFKTGKLSSYQKSICLKYLKNSRNIYNLQNDLNNYIHYEFNNTNRSILIEDLIALLSLIHEYDGDAVFNTVHDVFKNSDRHVQQGIIRGLFDYIGWDYDIRTPRIQRMFIELCDVVYSWNDDRLNADLLLYCLFCRTRDVFTSDDIYNSLEKFNDDVFYMFISDLSHGEYYKGAEAWYDMSDEEIEQVKDLIKSRNHPQEKNLLKKF